MPSHNPGDYQPLGFKPTDELPWWWRCRRHLDVGYHAAESIQDDTRRETITNALAALDASIDYATENQRRFTLVNIDELVDMAWSELKTQTINDLGKAKP